LCRCSEAACFGNGHEAAQNVDIQVHSCPVEISYLNLQ
jgi:hypothetical protein